MDPRSGQRGPTEAAHERGKPSPRAPAPPHHRETSRGGRATTTSSMRSRLGMWGARTITRDVLCPRCEYNLNGLNVGSPCPECGHQIQTVSTARAESEQLINAPRSYLRSLAAGATLVAAGTIVGAILGVRPRPAGFDASMVIGTIAAIGWFVGVWLLTRPRPTAIVREVAPRLEQRHARWATRASQLGWLAMPLGFGIAAMIDRQAITAAAVAGLAFTQPQSSQLAIFLAWTGGSIAFVGVLFFAYMLADLAEWASDEGLAERFKLAGFIVVTALPITAAAFAAQSHLGGAKLLGILLAMIAGLASVFGVLLLALCVVQFAWMSYWALANQSHAMHVEERRIERSREFERRVNARLDTLSAAASNGAPLDPADDPVLVLDPPAEQVEHDTGGEDPRSREAPVIPAESEHYIHRSGDSTPFELDHSSEVDATRDPRITRKKPL